jgi:hypothetical protein
VSGVLDNIILLDGRNGEEGSSRALLDGEIIGAGSRGVSGSPFGRVRITGPLSCRGGIIRLEQALLVSRRGQLKLAFCPFLPIATQLLRTVLG